MTSAAPNSDQNIARLSYFETTACDEAPLEVENSMFDQAGILSNSRNLSPVLKLDEDSNDDDYEVNKTITEPPELPAKVLHSWPSLKLPFVGVPPPVLSQPPPGYNASSSVVPSTVGLIKYPVSGNALSFPSTSSHELTNLPVPAVVPQSISNLPGSGSTCRLPGSSSTFSNVPAPVGAPMLPNVSSQNHTSVFSNVSVPSSSHGVTGASLVHGLPPANMLGLNSTHNLNVPGSSSILHGLPNVSRSSNANVLASVSSQQSVGPGISSVNIPLTPQSIPASSPLSSGYLSQPFPVQAHTSSASALQPVVFNNQNSYSANSSTTVAYQQDTPHIVGNQAPAGQHSQDSELMQEQHHLSQSKLVKLPRNWRTATDSEGNVYYYHSITRKTQWDPPEDSDSEDDDSDSSLFDEPKIKHLNATTAVADTNFETSADKKLKEQFLTKMSLFVVNCLNAYRKPDCKVGRIQTTEDFKYLAKKLTHFVMLKQLKRCKNLEKLKYNKKIEHKAKDYITKYMHKFGSCYQRDNGRS